MLSASARSAIYEWMNEWMFICTVTKMNLHNKTYMQDNKATLAALTGAL